ncbi:MAG: ABC transporter permease [Alphaproteobacteria bacterium]|nr:ABC transporter permease [Alphaproteobacteria bacterium]
MTLLGHVLEALRNLLGAKQRSILALLGVVIGTGSVIAMMGTGQFAAAEVMRQFEAMGTDLLMISLRADRGRGDPRAMTERAGTLADGLPHLLSAAEPVVLGDARTRIGGAPRSLPIIGARQGFLDVNRAAVVEGRFISDLDLYGNFCVLGAKVAIDLAPGGRLLGMEIPFEDRVCTVIGVLDSLPAGFAPYQLDRGVVMPFSTTLRMRKDASPGVVVARLKPGIDYRAAQGEVKAWFASLPGVDADVRSPEQVIEQMERQSRMFTLMLGAIGSISLLVGGVGVMNIMLVSVTERRKEIGIRMAIGARARDIRNQFLIESSMLTCFGGALGVAVGLGAAWGIARASGWQFFVPWGAVALGFGVSASIGVFFGYYPAHQASRLDPITALRSS